MHAVIHVFTFKSGLLARVAHDLRLTVRRHQLTLRSRRLQAFADAASLEVDGALTAHGLDPNALSASDKRQVMETVRSEILHSDRHPRIELEGEITGAAAEGGWQLRGTVRVRAQARPLSVEVVVRDQQLQAAFELKPSEFGIAPYKALAGAIKLQDRVRVSIDISLDGRDPDSLLNSAEPLTLTAAES